MAHPPTLLGLLQYESFYLPQCLLWRFYSKDRQFTLILYTSFPGLISHDNLAQA